MRSRSTAAQSGMRGRLPVDSRMASASISVTPSAVSTAIAWAPLSRAVPWIMRTPWLLSSSTMLSSSRVSMSFMRLRTPSRSSCAVALARPMPSLASTSPMRPAVAIMAFDGMQSRRWAAPPTTSRSIIVTSAPSRAAVVAAVLPAGPPPMITKRRGMPTGYGRRPPASPPVSTLGSGEAHQAVVGGEQPAGQPQADDHDVGGDAAEDEVHDRRLHQHGVDGVDVGQDETGHRPGQEHQPDRLGALDLRGEGRAQGRADERLRCLLPGLAQREAGLDLGPAGGGGAPGGGGGGGGRGRPARPPRKAGQPPSPTDRGRARPVRPPVTPRYPQ